MLDKILFKKQEEPLKIIDKLKEEALNQYGKGIKKYLSKKNILGYAMDKEKVYINIRSDKKYRGNRYIELAYSEDFNYDILSRNNLGYFLGDTNYFPVHVIYLSNIKIYTHSNYIKKILIKGDSLTTDGYLKLLKSKNENNIVSLAMGIKMSSKRYGDNFIEFVNTSDYDSYIKDYELFLDYSKLNITKDDMYKEGIREIEKRIEYEERILSNIKEELREINN